MKKVFYVFILFLIFTLTSCNNLFPGKSEPEIKPEPKEFLVNYFSSENVTLPESIIVPENYVLTDDDLPELFLNQHNFLGWYKKISEWGGEFISAGYKVTENLNLYASFEPIQKVKYLVQYYFENIEDDDYSLIEKTFYNYPGEMTDVEPSNYYSYKEPVFDQQIIAADGSTVIKLYYERKRYTLTFDTDGGTEIEPVTYKHGTKIDEKSFITTKAGYKFAYWEPRISSDVTSDKTYTAYWNKGIDTEYTVNHYYENLETGVYDLLESVSCTGVTEAETKAYVKYKTGYKNKSFEQNIIKGDGSTVINIFYDVLDCVANFYDYENNLVATFTGKYGEKIPEITAPEREFYNFIEWRWFTVPCSGYFDSEEKDYTAYYKPYPTVKYTINHHYQNIENDDYTIESEIKYGQVGRLTETYPKYSVIEFEINSRIEDKIIKEDESTVVDIYYDRLVYTVTFYILDYEGYMYKSISVKAGSKLPEIENPVREHYKFTGWKQKLPDTVYKNEKIVANWESLTRTYQVTHLWEILNDYTYLQMNEYTFETGEQIEDFIENIYPDLQLALYPFEYQYEYLSGDLGEQTQYQHKTRKKEEHYNVLPYEQKIIEDTIENKDINDITIYYTLKKYTFTFIVDGKEKEKIERKYGSKALASIIYEYNWDQEVPKYIDGDRTFIAVSKK